MGNLKISILAVREDGWYIYGTMKRDYLARISMEMIGPPHFDVQFDHLFYKTYNYIIYNPALEKRIMTFFDVGIDKVYEVRQNFAHNYSTILDDGYSTILMKR